MRSSIERPIFVDALAIAAITFASAIPYLPHLGFYSDDWGLIAGFDVDQSAWSADSIGSAFAARPIQGLYLVALFKVFGLWPLGYHVINSIVLAIACALFYLLLIRLHFQRAPSFAAALLFVMLPQLSTVRVWYAAFQIPLSLALTLISMHCLLSYAHRRGSGWLAASIFTAVLSIGAYEIFAPLLAGFAFAVGYVTLRSASKRHSGPMLAAIAIAGSAFLGAIYKTAFSSRTGNVLDPSRYYAGLRQFFRLDYDWRLDSSLNVFVTPQTHFLKPVEGWWAGAQSLITGNADTSVTVIAILIAALAWWRLNSANSSDVVPTQNRFILTGAAAFVLGNATFLLVPSVVFTSTGMGNRVHVAAALGVAILFSAGISILASNAPGRGRGILFSLIAVIITVFAFARLSSIERYWAEAPAIQKQILTVAQTDLRDVPANSTIIMTGICPYHGPAVIFETYWDVGGALTLALGRPVAGDVATPRMVPTRRGLVTSIYRELRFYPYGNRLYLYDPARRELSLLANAQAASNYFSRNDVRACPGDVARGSEV